MKSVSTLAAGLAVAGTAIAATAAVAAPGAGPPPPTTKSGAPATVLAGPGAVPTPTSFAFGKGTVFAGSGSGEGKPAAPGGVYKVAGGQATLIPGTPHDVYGVAWKGGKLYVSGVKRLLVYKGWNGSTFKSKKVIFKAPKSLPGINGLAFGPDGRLYMGASLDQKFDHKTDKRKYAQAVLSVKPNGKDLQIVAQGLRQPFQLAFVKGHKYPYVSVLSQDKTKVVPPDFLVVAKPGQDYGFARCTWASKKACKGYAKPVKFFSPHTSPMGLGVIGHSLYVSEFGKQRVVKLSLKTKQAKPFLKGYPAPVIGLGVHRGFIYTGDLTGTIYRAKG